jgi:ribosomal-protein-alanine N-acetyltransferase
MARVSLPTPTLRTARLQLRPFTDADAEALFALHSNAYVLRYWDAPPWTERARAERFIAACGRMAEEGSGARLAMDRVSDKAFIGWCHLTRWNPDYRSASMGYCLDDAAWGNGYATEAGRALRQWRPSSGQALRRPARDLGERDPPHVHRPLQPARDEQHDQPY